MSAVYPDIRWSQDTAIARLVEYAADNFLHSNLAWHHEEYTSTDIYDGLYDEDISESFQRRIGGCGVPSYTITLLARALNIPAVVDHPNCIWPSGPGQDAHRYTHFPTHQWWVHGDAVVATGSGLGVVGEALLWREQDIYNLDCLTKIIET